MRALITSARQAAPRRLIFSLQINSASCPSQVLHLHLDAHFDKEEPLVVEFCSCRQQSHRRLKRRDTRIFVFASMRYITRELSRRGGELGKSWQRRFVHTSSCMERSRIFRQVAAIAVCVSRAGKAAMQLSRTSSGIEQSCLDLLGSSTASLQSSATCKSGKGFANLFMVVQMMLI